MAARVEPGRVQATHQSMHHLIAKADWSDGAVLAVVRARVLPAIERHGPIQAWIIDDTGFPKKGTHSVGVARQYCGQLGKQDNCQVAVSLSVANDHASLPVAYRLYLPQAWAEDTGRRAQGRRARRPVLRHQAADRARADPRRPGRRHAARRRAGRCRLRRGHRLPRRHHRAWPGLCRRHPVRDQPLAARPGAAAGQALERARPAAISLSAAAPSTSPSSAKDLAAGLPRRPGAG